MTYPVINRLKLINLVCERPALWDKTADIYKDKQLKAATWREICVILNKDYEQLDEKEREQYCKFVIKIWTHTRDSWMRSLNNRKSAKNSGSLPRPYKYNKNMSFLKKVINPTKTFDHITNESEGEESEEDEEVSEENESIVFYENDWNVDMIKTEIDDTAKNEDTNRIDTTVKIHDNITTEDINAKIKAYMNNHLNEIRNTSDSQLEDRHFAFFKSIQPSLALLDDDSTLEFQSGVLNILRNIKRGMQLNYDSPSSSSQRRCTTSSCLLPPEVPPIVQTQWSEKK